MKPQGTYLIREFASLAGVTVRALHHYDRIGLLRPSLHTEAGHRLYRQDDLLKLQQILIFKLLGFTLEEIRDLLANPHFDLRQSLQAQKEAVDQRINELQAISYAISEAIRADQVDLDRVAVVVRLLTSDETRQTLRRYFTDEQSAWLEVRGLLFTPEMVQEGTRNWSELAEKFADVQHLPPEHPHVQALAAEMHRLVSVFTGGNESIRQSLSAMYSDAGDDFFGYALTGMTRELHEFMGRALAIYQQSSAAGQSDP